MAHKSFTPIPGAQTDRVWPKKLADRWMSAKSEVKEYGEKSIRSELELTQDGWERFTGDIEKIVDDHYERWPEKQHYSVRRTRFQEDAVDVIKHWQTSFNIPTPTGQEISPLLRRMFWDWFKHKQGRKYRTKSAKAKAKAEVEADIETVDAPSSTQHHHGLPVRPSPAPSTIWNGSVSPTEFLGNECEPEPVLPFHIPHGQPSFQLLICDGGGNQKLLGISDIQHGSFRGPATISRMDSNKLVEQVIESDVVFDPTVHTFELVVHQKIAGMQATDAADLRQLVQAAYNEKPTQPCILAVAEAKKKAPWSRKRSASQQSASSPSQSIAKKRQVDTTPLRTRPPITPSLTDI
jgi:hypothetical protein